MGLNLTPEQERIRQQLLAGVVLLNDKPLADPEKEASVGRAKLERKAMAAADKVDAVKALQRRGFKVFPLTPGEKAPPLIRDWPRLATDDPALAGLWEDQPDANIGVHCDGLLVVDVDTKNGGPDSLALLDMLEGFPATLTTRTPTGGRHLFFRLPEGHPGVPNSAGTLGRGLDIRSTRGYVVAPGSRVAAGEYRFEDPTAEVATAPDWLVARLGVVTPREPKAAGTVPDARDDVLERAREWLRTTAPDAGGYLLACGLRDRGVSEAQAADLLMSGEAPAGSWPEAEARARAANAFRYAKGEPGAAVATLDDFQVVAVAPAPPPRPAKAAVRLDDFAASTAIGHGYVVKGLLQRASYALAFGPPGSGKTFVALDVAYHVAAGKDWHGRRVRGGPVLYLAYEGAGGLRARAAALRHHYGTASVPLYFDDNAYNLREREGRAALGATITAMGVTPAMIVIDTLAHALCGGDENSAQDVSAFNAGVQALIAATGACVLVIHHPGKDITKGSRGSSALLGAVDTELAVHSGRVQPTKQRDIELGEAIGFRLRPVPVGMDDDGDVVTSCVVESATVVPDQNTDRLKVGSATHLAYECLKELRPDNSPITDREWKAACETFLPKRRSAWDEVKYKLKRMRLVVQDDDGCWARKLE